MLRSIVVATLMLFAAGGAFAQNPAGPKKPAKVISKSHQPVGTPHKASSFAPHPTKRRVFGDPIQAPIMHSAPAPKKPAPK
ncbi:MAG: hypothetical protein JSR66_03325 [Proteobacteria bacterium]|nr:hypothetical protein [Pseudomonadota bacterium]